MTITIALVSAFGGAIVTGLFGLLLEQRKFHLTRIKIDIEELIATIKLISTSATELGKKLDSYNKFLIPHSLTYEKTPDRLNNERSSRSEKINELTRNLSSTRPYSPMLPKEMHEAFDTYWKELIKATNTQHGFAEWVRKANNTKRKAASAEFNQGKRIVQKALNNLEEKENGLLLASTEATLYLKTILLHRGATKKYRIHLQEASARLNDFKHEDTNKGGPSL